MYKIFINENPLLISDKESDLKTYKNYRLSDDDDKSLLRAIETLEFHDLNHPNFGILVLSNNADETFKRFKKLYELVTAGGGIIFNPEGQLLLILRQGKWDLPKGKNDPGEKIENTALREVMEECGLKKVNLEKFITHSYHTYFLEGKRVLKTTHWYKMNTESNPEMEPQTEENITELKWTSISDINIKSLDTYNSIREVLAKII